MTEDLVRDGAAVKQVCTAAPFLPTWANTAERASPLSDLNSAFPCAVTVRPSNYSLTDYYKFLAAAQRPFGSSWYADKAKTP